MLGNTKQKKNFVFGHFSRSGCVKGISIHFALSSEKIWNR